MSDVSGRRSTEGGLALVVLALSMVVLLIFTAFVIDLGQLFLERRVDQNAADASATSGGVVFLTDQTLQSAVTEVVAKVDADMPRAVTTAQWTGCSDTGQLEFTAAELTLTPATACISFSRTFTRLRVRLPNQTIQTFFSRVVGIDSVTSTAFAEIGLDTLGGGALPFVVLAVNGPGDQICLRTNDTAREPPDHPAVPPYQPGRELDPCHEDSFDSAEGGRGTLLPWQYSDCTSTGDQSIASGIMVGMDHPLGVGSFPTLNPGDDADLLDNPAIVPDVRIDGGPSNTCRNPFPNAIDVDSGLTSPLLRCALLEAPCTAGTPATDTLNGRLSASGSGATFTGLGINDVALWNYFVASVPSGSCTDAKTPPAAMNFNTRRAALLDCLQNWSSGVLFTDAVASNPRFGYVPRIAELGMCRIQPASGTACTGPLPDHVHINNFSPVYIDGVYQQGSDACDATNPAFIPPLTGPDRWAIHYPGDGLDCGSSTAGVDRVSGIVLPCGALPPSVCDPTSNPPFPDPSGLIQVRLTR